MNYGVFLISWMILFLLGGSLIANSKSYKKEAEDDKAKIVRAWFLVSFICGLGMGALTG